VEEGFISVLEEVSFKMYFLGVNLMKAEEYINESNYTSYHITRNAGNLYMNVILKPFLKKEKMGLGMCS
jgi:hypothetical protein